MKVALLKQTLDVFGPWESIPWSRGVEYLASRWPGKGTYWELTTSLQADWFVLPQRLDTDYTKDAIHKYPGRRETLERHVKNAVQIADIPFDEYDVVVTFDPILPPIRTRALLAYFCQEHWDRYYLRSLRRPMGCYDLFLDHMLVAAPELTELPQAIGFPYVRDPKEMALLSTAPKDEVVWVDWRTLTALAMRDLWCAEAEAARMRLQEVLGLAVRAGGSVLSSTYCFQEEPAWGDFLRYYRELGQCKYYMAVAGVNGAGQGAGDAASLGCIIFGDGTKSYHRLLCHPACLCDSLLGLPERFLRVRASCQLQEEILAWQDRALREHFVGHPRNVLLRGVEGKTQLQAGQNLPQRLQRRAAESV